MHFWNSFSGFVFAVLFFPPPGLVWILLAIVTVLKNPASTLHTYMKILSKMLPIVTSIASGEKPKSFFFFLVHKKMSPSP